MTIEEILLGESKNVEFKENLQLSQISRYRRLMVKLLLW